MTNNSTHPDDAFIARQRERLIQLRAELLSVIDSTVAEETDLQNRFVDDAQELEDDSQRLNILDNDAALVQRNRERVRAVERALQKIEDGTYGFSDLSNRPIARELLEAIPETVLAKDERPA